MYRQCMMHGQKNIKSSTLCTGSWVGPDEMIWMGAENFAHTGIRSPEHSARRESIYRLSYPGLTDFEGTFHNQLEATTESSMLYLYFLMHTHTHTHTHVML